MAIEKVEFVLNKTNERIEQAIKHNSIDLLVPIAFINQPDKKPPINPPMPSIIMIMPLSFCPSPVVINPCIHVGIHKKIAQSPINIVPKINEPLIRSLRCSFEKILTF